MKNSELFETTPVLFYGPSSVKAIDFEFQENRLCFQTHWHDRMEILRIHEGKIKITLGTKSLYAEKDEIVLIPPMTVHTGFALTDCRYTAIMFDLRLFYNKTEVGEKFLPAVFDGTAVFSEVTDTKTVLADADFISQQTGNGKDALKIMAGVYKLISDIYEFCLCEYSTFGTFDKSIKKATDFINDNMQNDITTLELSNYCGYTVPYFCKKFKENTGLSPMNYLKICRLEKAYSLLKEEKLKISEIALLCGFSDNNYFTRCFTARFSHPPTYYRKNR